MCVVSMIIDHYKDKWEPKPYEPWNPGTNPYPTLPPMPWNPLGEAERIKKLEEEVEELKKLLARAREYDKRNNEPDCEVQEKIDALKRIAKERGIDISGTGI